MIALCAVLDFGAVARRTAASAKKIMLNAIMNDVTNDEVIHDLEKSEDQKITSFAAYIKALNASGFDLDQKYVYWGELRPTVFELIKGKRTPLAFSFTLLLTKNDTTQILARRQVTVGEDLPSLFLQVRFDHSVGHMVTGTARNTFTLDKSLDEAWDAEVRQLMKAMELAVEEE